MVAACGGSSRPAVIPKLSELPGDSQKRDAALDSAHAEPTPEQHAPLTKKERKAETIAASAAAVIGSLLSSSENVTLGVGTSIDEDAAFDPAAQQRAHEATEAEQERRHEARHRKHDGRTDDSVDIPWVRLK